MSVAEYCDWTLLLNAVTERYLTKHCVLSLVLLNNVLHWMLFTEHCILQNTVLQNTLPYWTPWLSTNWTLLLNTVRCVALLKFVSYRTLYLAEHCLLNTVFYWTVFSNKHCILLNTLSYWTLYGSKHCILLNTVSYWTLFYWTLYLSKHCILLNTVSK